MNPDPFALLHTLFLAGLLATLAFGVVLHRNFDRWFGPHRDIPADGASAQFYTKTEVALVWASAVKTFLFLVCVF